MKNQTRLVAFFAGLAAVLLCCEALQAQQIFYPLAQPCRAIDTRNALAANGGPALTTARRDFQIRGVCGVPAAANAVAINVTITGATTTSWLTLWPSNLAQPAASTINFSETNWALANGAVMTLGTATLDLAIRNANGGVHVIVDVTGYYR